MNTRNTLGSACIPGKIHPGHSQMQTNSSPQLCVREVLAQCTVSKGSVCSSPSFASPMKLFLEIPLGFLCKNFRGGDGNGECCC